MCEYILFFELPNLEYLHIVTSYRYDDLKSKGYFKLVILYNIVILKTNKYEVHKVVFKLEFEPNAKKGFLKFKFKLVSIIYHSNAIL